MISLLTSYNIAILSQEKTLYTTRSLLYAFHFRRIENDRLSKRWFNESVEINATEVEEEEEKGIDPFKRANVQRGNGYEPLSTRLSVESRVLLSVGEKLFLTSIF